MRPKITDTGKAIAKKHRKRDHKKPVYVEISPKKKKKKNGSKLGQEAAKEACPNPKANAGSPDERPAGVVSQGGAFLLKEASVRPRRSDFFLEMDLLHDGGGRAGSVAKRSRGVDSVRRLLPTISACSIAFGNRTKIINRGKRLTNR